MDRSLEALDHVVRLGEGQLARELDVERDLVGAPHAHHAHVVDLAHLGHRRRGRGGLLAQTALGRDRLDVHDDVGVAQRLAHELLHGIGGRVRLADALVRRDADHEVREVAPGRVADADAAQLERLAQAGERRPDPALRIGRTSGP